MRYISDGRPTPRSAYLGEDGFLARMMSSSSKPWGFWAVEQDGRFLGWFHLRPLPTSRSWRSATGSARMPGAAA